MGRLHAQGLCYVGTEDEPGWRGGSPLPSVLPFEYLRVMVLALDPPAALPSRGARPCPLPQVLRFVPTDLKHAAADACSLSMDPVGRWMSENVRRPVQAAGAAGFTALSAQSGLVGAAATRQRSSSASNSNSYGGSNSGSSGSSSTGGGTSSRRGSKVLCVGLGAGMLPSFWAWHDPTARVSVIELDPLVISVARGVLGVQFTELGSIEELVQGGAAPRQWRSGGDGELSGAGGVYVACGDAGEAMAVAATAASRPEDGQDLILLDAFGESGALERSRTRGAAARYTSAAAPHTPAAARALCTLVC